MELGTEVSQSDERTWGTEKRPHQRFAGALAAGAVVAILLAITASQGTEPPESAKEAVKKFATASASESAAGRLRIAGDVVWRWDDPAGDAYLLEGGCRLERDGARIEGDRLLALVSRDRSASADPIASRPANTFRVAVILQRSGKTQHQEVLTVVEAPNIAAPWYRGRPASIPSAIDDLRGWLNQSRINQASGSTGPRDGGVRQAQFEQLAPGTAAPIPAAPPLASLPNGDAQPSGQNGLQFLLGGGSQSIEFAPRGGGSMQIDTRSIVETGETVVVVRDGATVTVRDVQATIGDGRTFELGTISISADRIVGWLPALAGLIRDGTSLSEADGELYLEGDIVFRQGDRVIYADRMYYNIGREFGTILSAEAITSIPEYQGFVRLKADVLQQISKGEFVGFGAAVTSSRMGVPRYWLQSEQVRFSDRPVTRIDPLSGQAYADSEQTVSSSGNAVYLGGFPVFYWPTFSTDLEKPNFYLTGLKLRNDDIFGTQVLADFDVFQLFGVQTPPEGVDWTLSTDYLSERGPAIGTKITYSVPGLHGIPGPVVGFLDAWAIDDSGLDTLGSDRRLLEPEENVRGRLLLRHRHYLPNDFELIAEAGVLSDRNFLEQYLENEWDHDKDHDTQLRLRKYHFNHLFDLHAEARVNDFYTDTNRLPQLDHYMLGNSFLTERLNWSAHNRVGYAHLEVADAPENPIEQAKFTTLPGEADSQGMIASTKQELAAPFTLGILKLSPYVSGEASYWGEDINGQELTRLLGQTGVRGSLPAWRLYPGVESSLLNIRGLAHKTELRGELFYADANQNLDQLPLYDPLDDDAQEQFRRRFIFNTFGGALPPKYDPRLYAFRQGIQRYVTTPSPEIADDLTQGRIGFHQRLQTKRGLPGRERIVDLVRFDVDTILFLDEEETNFGEQIGPTRYDFRYHVGDRVTLLSDGYFDFFDEGLRSVSAGVLSSRPGLGEVYLGVLSLEGPVSSTVLRANIDYRMNQKWIISAGTTFDLGDVGNVGQRLALTRIGESVLLRMGINVDEGRDNVGFQFMVEPRFWPSQRLGELGGKLIPPPGIEGLE